MYKKNLRALFSEIATGASAKTVWSSMRAEQVSVAKRWRRPRSDPEYRTRRSGTVQAAEKGSHPARIVLSACLFGVCAFAGASAATVDELGAVNAETVLLRAQAERENARLALIKAQRDARAPACAHVRLPDALPQARRITSVNGAREATLVYLDHQVEVREGDALDGGYIVQRISPQARRVELKNRAGRIVRIPLSGAAHMPVEAAAAPLPEPIARFDRPPANPPSAMLPPPAGAFAPSSPPRP
ncbi:type IV pilus biogenesis protein PilP [Candidatus Glomeribacter gigasporarum]|uniref:type IV pilus biogenesis protein PilP n=1 Tax=Candidatus Glomeribacter gigasporarum TaxID=132144 RepID=UPI001315A2E4|nr:type IV pilus biogenesis protein PilP [Candidatus Glomeribacter gigasporarum]